MTDEESDLLPHRVLIDACLRNLVPFAWHGPGALLIAPAGIAAVLRDVVTQGHQIVGLEGFELVATEIHPRLDLIFDAEQRADGADAVDVAERWPPDVWVDVVLKLVGVPAERGLPTS